MSESHENSQENIHPALRKCRFVFLEDFGPLFTLPHWFWMVENKISIFLIIHLLTPMTVFLFPEFYLLWASISLTSSLVPRVTRTWFFVTINHSVCIRIKLHHVHLYKTSISRNFKLWTLIFFFFTIPRIFIFDQTQNGHWCLKS